MAVLLPQVIFMYLLSWHDLIQLNIFTVFVAKMIQKNSPLTRYFAGLYTYGQPNIGDEDFGKSFSSDITCKIFNHTYNNGK